MTVISDATADFVLATRDRLELALEVEAAMADVRGRLALAFLRSLETYLRVRIEDLPGDGWSVTAKAPDGSDMMARAAYVALQRANWPVLPGEAQEADFHCVCLQTNKPNWGAPWVGIYAYRAEPPLARRLTEAAARAVGLADQESPAWWWLESPLNDWRQPAFLLTAGYSALRQGAEAEPVRDLRQQMLALARAAAPIYDEFESSGQSVLVAS